MSDVPIACTLTERELAERRGGLLTELRRHREDIRWLPDGPVWLELTGGPGTREFLEAQANQDA